MDKKLLTTQETAKLLGLSDGRIRTMIIDGKIPATKFGKQNMIKRTDAEKVKVYGKVGRPKTKPTVPTVPQVEKPESKTMLSVEAAAAFLKCSEKEIKKMVSDGRLPSEKVGGRRLVNEKDLKAVK